MADFSPTNAAFEGFRVARRAPMAVVAWGLAYMAGMAAALGAGFALARPLLTMEFQPPENQRQVLGVIWAMLPGMLLMMAIMLVLGALVVTAMYRSVLQPEKRGGAYLRFGADELRVLAVQFLVWLIIMGVYVLLATPMFAVAWTTGTGDTAQNFGGTFLLFFLTFLAVIAAVITLLVRFSLAIPITLTKGRISIFESWRMTRGRFWPLLGAYALAAVFAFGISIVGGILASIITVPLMVANMPAVGEAQSVSDLPTQGMWTTQIIAQVINAFFSTLGLAILACASAAVYRDLTGPGPESVF